MTTRQGAFLCAVAACFAGVVLLASLLGPSRRTYLPQPQVLPFASTGALLAWSEAQGLRGRRAVVLARHLIPAEAPAGDSPEIGPLTAMMHRGVVRELFQVVPAADWPAVAWNLSTVSIFRPEGQGRVANFEDGRVHAAPLPAFWPPEEPVLLLLHPPDWSPQELEDVESLLRSRRLRADVIAVLRGTEEDLARWRAVVSSIPQ